MGARWEQDGSELEGCWRPGDFGIGIVMAKSKIRNDIIETEAVLGIGGRIKTETGWE